LKHEDINIISGLGASEEGIVAVIALEPVVL